MRNALLMVATVALWIGGAPANPNKDGGIMAADDWHSLSIYGVAADENGPLYLQVHAGDLDGDGRPDDSVLKLVCADGTVKQAFFHEVKAPRDVATGQASGKRTHKPVTFVKEWGPATPQLLTMKAGYDIKKAEGIRMTADGGGWTAVELSNADGLCPAAQAAAINNSKSNIK